MTITHKLTLDLQRKGELQRIDVVQGDALTRKVELTLLCGGTPWIIPDCEPVVRYCKSDGTVGVYDTLPTQVPAITHAGHTLTLVLAPQMLTCPGPVQVQVELNAQDLKLATFTFAVVVEPGVALAGESEDYVNWTKAFLPQTTGAQVGQRLQVAAVDNTGRIIGVETVDASDEEALQAALSANDLAERANNKATEAIQIATEVAQEMEAYSPSGTRSIAEAAMRMASNRLVAPDAAQVGQYVQVAEVDENGGITKMIAVDAPSDGGSGGNACVFTHMLTTTEDVGAIDTVFPANLQKFQIINVHFSIPSLAESKYLYGVGAGVCLNWGLCEAATECGAHIRVENSLGNGRWAASFSSSTAGSTHARPGDLSMDGGRIPDTDTYQLYLNDGVFPAGTQLYIWGLYAL